MGSGTRRDLTYSPWALAMGPSMDHDEPHMRDINHHFEASLGRAAGLVFRFWRSAVSCAAPFSFPSDLQSSDF